MPNWATGNVRVTGKPSDVEAFCKLFLFKDTAEPQIYFARSFIHQNWNDFKKEYLGKASAEFGVDFAWSCHTCLIEGYPNGQDCITLVGACKKFKVEIIIDTEEGGMGFEEHVECDKDGSLIEECYNMPTFKCARCKNIQLIPSSYDVGEEECWECENIGGWRFVRK